MEIENLSGITERGIDLFFRPDVECPFLRLDMAAVIRLRRSSLRSGFEGVGVYGGQAARSYNGAVGVFCRKKSAFF